MASTQTTSTVPVMFHDRCVVATDLHCDGGARRLVWLKSLLLRCQQLSSPLLILGDLFDLWWGPGQIKASDTRLELEALKMAVRSGTAISLLPGNRDFLLDQSFQDETGVEILGDAVDMRIGGLRWHFSHGDLFGTEDQGYQRLRKFLRHPVSRHLLLSLPSGVSKKLAGGIRKGSRRSIARKTTISMQPDLRSVEALVGSGYDRVVCGHFHKERFEQIHCAGRQGEFRILEPFEDRGAYLYLDGPAVKLEWLGDH